MSKNKSVKHNKLRVHTIASIAWKIFVVFFIFAFVISAGVLTIVSLFFPPQKTQETINLEQYLKDNNIQLVSGTPIATPTNAPVK
jgi:hypothetical protein